MSASQLFRTGALALALVSAGACSSDDETKSDAAPKADSSSTGGDGSSTSDTSVSTPDGGVSIDASPADGGDAASADGGGDTGGDGGGDASGEAGEAGG